MGGFVGLPELPRADASALALQRKLYFIDLFSCVGCHALGMQRAGIEPVALCESNPWRREVLARNHPEVPIYDDVRTFDNHRADIVFGGPPCQKTSVAAAIHGRRTGESLWAEMLRVGRGAVSCFVVEQPPGNAAWEAEVIGDLSDAGFFVGRFEFGAHDVGAPYIRRRVYLVAFTSLSRLEVARRSLPSSIDRAKRAAASRGDWDPTTIPAFGMDTWRSEPVDERRERIEALGDSNPPAMAEAIGYMLQAAYADGPLEGQDGRLRDEHSTILPTPPSEGGAS